MWSWRCGIARCGVVDHLALTGTEAGKGYCSSGDARGTTLCAGPDFACGRAAQVRFFPRHSVYLSSLPLYFSPFQCPRRRPLWRLLTRCRHIFLGFTLEGHLVSYSVGITPERTCVYYLQLWRFHPPLPAKLVRFCLAYPCCLFFSVLLLVGSLPCVVLWFVLLCMSVMLTWHRYVLAWSRVHDYFLGRCYISSSSKASGLKRSNIYASHKLGSECLFSRPNRTCSHVRGCADLFSLQSSLQPA